MNHKVISGVLRAWLAPNYAQEGETR